jgi:tetratricopeptide (TPR) repeat protein
MRAFVFTDKALGRDAGRFVWLSINTEKATNNEFLRKFPVQVWPSLYVINPSTEKVSLRWVGGATVPQLHKLFDDGERAVRGRERGVAGILARADKFYGEGKNAEAAKEYRAALKAAPPQWPQYGRTVESLLFALAITNASQECATIALETWPRLRDTSSTANVAGSGLDCALGLPKETPNRAEMIRQLREDALAAIANTRAKIAGDDISGAYDELVSEREDAKDESGKKRLLDQWAAFLEKQAAEAKTPEQRAAYDPHRVGVYLQMKQPERGLAMLEASERDLPDDYNPPARLAVLYKALKRYDDALAASDRALSKAYGPRKVGILQTRSDIYRDKGDLAAAKTTMVEALSFAEALPAGQRSETQIAALKKKMAGDGK